VSAADAAETPTLAVRGIRKAFGGVAVLHGLDLEVRGGEILALLGENGAGKSTLSNIIAGALHADEGTIALDGRLRNWAGPRDALQAGVALVHQELSTVRSLSVAENIFLGDYCADRRGFVDRAAMRRRARMLLDEVGATHIRTAARAGRLGTADQQLVEIAKTLTREVRVLMMDEPTSSLTPHETEALFRVMRRLAGRGVALIFISHRLEEVFAVADRIVVLRDGRKVSDRPVAAATAAGVIADMTGRAALFARSAIRSEVGGSCCSPCAVCAITDSSDRSTSTSVPARFSACSGCSGPGGPSSSRRSPACAARRRAECASSTAAACRGARARPGRAALRSCRRIARPAASCRTFRCRKICC
jgi:ABC-type sugar transport system ATPase subunit